MKTILITGGPATGKSKLAKKLSLLLDYAYFDVGSYIKKAHLYNSYDRKRHTYVVDASKLAENLLKVREKAMKRGEKGIIFDSHMSHFLPSRYADLCIVTLCDLSLLKRRLQKRGYKTAKIRENLDAEIFDTCLVEATEKNHRIVTINTANLTSVSIENFSKKVKNILAHPNPDVVRT